MNVSPMRTLVVVAAFASVPAIAGATPPRVARKPSACGVKILPLVEGNSWTYEPTPAPRAAPPDITRISPPRADALTITVKKVETKGPDTTVTLEEKTTYNRPSKDPKKPVTDERTITTTITCNAKKFEISPDSFFFAGEPGGAAGVKLDTIERPKDTSWKLTNGGIGDADWREDVIAHWTRIATPGSDANLGSGKLWLERVFTPQPKESVTTKTGQYTAEKIGISVTGRVALDGAPPDIKPMELPAGWLDTVWLADGVGVVQVLNAYAQQYTLVASAVQ